MIDLVDFSRKNLATFGKLLLPVLALTISTHENKEPLLPVEIPNANVGWTENSIVENVPYDLYIPENYSEQEPIKTMLVLPGWNFPRQSWLENTSLEAHAERYGYILIVPDMLQTLYASSYYPETQLQWHPLPGGVFVRDRLIPAIQSRHSLLMPEQFNTLLGLSTGGRGVVLIALENPSLFDAGASLSGDFNQETTPDDRLMTAVYGPYTDFTTRWQGRDNPQSRAEEWQIPLYLTHGTEDDIVPFEQSSDFYAELIRWNNNERIVEFHPVDGAGHDYEFWDGQLPAIFEFLERKASGSQ